MRSTPVERSSGARAADGRERSGYASPMSLEDVLAAIARAPIDTRPDDEIRAEIARNAECDPSGPWVPHEVVTALLAERAREGDEAAAEE